jgi:hypothetical protein
MPNGERKGLRARYKVLTLPAKIAGGVGSLVLTCALLGFFVAPPVAKMVLEKKLPILLHRPVSIGKITLNRNSYVTRSLLSPSQKPEVSILDFETREL